MQATRKQFVSFLEWVVAAAVVAALAAVGSTLTREIRTLSAVTPVMAGENLPDAPPAAGGPLRAVSVPMLLLSDGVAIRVGERLDSVAARLANASEIRPEVVEPSPAGQRVTRFYEYGAARFVLVLEPFEPNGEQRVAAIYIQQVAR
jgi:hypothetical protein